MSISIMVFNFPGILEGLRDALGKIREDMGSDDQFILFVTDHGDIHRAIKDVTLKTGETKLSMTLDRNFVQQLTSTDSNDHLTGRLNRKKYILMTGTWIYR